MKSKCYLAVLAFCMIFIISGCSLGKAEVSPDDETSGTPEETDETLAQTEDNYRLEDNPLLYAEDEDDSVITMYLTVSEGNKSENTNHTWTEVNSYSTYYYEEHGIERYAVNGLLQVGDENGPLEGELGYGKFVPNAIVTVRGQTSSRNAQKNYKIELTDGKGTWRDQKVINLNKHQDDGVRFRNKLCYDLLEELPELVSMRTQFVHLYVKDNTQGGEGEFEDYGLYTQVEQPNKSFLKRHGFDKNGQLYKINLFEFFRYEDIIKLKNDAEYDAEAFEELLEIKGNDDHSKLIAMLEDVNDYSIPIEDTLNKWFDTDNIVSWMAFHILVGNIDTQSRNTLLYSPLNGEKWYFISWDCDAAFRLTEYAILDKDNSGGWEHGVSNYWGNVLFQRLLKSDYFREKLDDKIEEYHTILNAEKLSSMIKGYKDTIKDYVFGNTDRYYELLTEEQYDLVCDSIPGEVDTNYQMYKDSLKEPMPFFIGTPEYAQGSILFNWDNSFDFNDENIYYTFELADNLEFENPIVKEEDIFIPGYAYKRTLEPGQYFVRVKAKNESGKEQYAFDYYVSDGSVKNYGIICFYVTEAGTIEVDTYDE